MAAVHALRSQVPVKRRANGIADRRPIGTLKGTVLLVQVANSEKPYKALGIDLLGQALRDREAAIDTFIECHQAMESAVLADPAAGPKAFRRLRAAAVNETFGRHLTALDGAIAANTTLARDAAKDAEAAAHLAELRAEPRSPLSRWNRQPLPNGGVPPVGVSV